MFANTRYEYIFPNSIGRSFALSEYYQMNEIGKDLKNLFDRILRRHTANNVKEMYSIFDAYEDLLKRREANARYEKAATGLFEASDPIPGHH